MVVIVHDNFTLSDEINGPLLAAVICIEMIGGLITNSFVLILTACHLKTWKQPTTIFLSNMLLNNLIVNLFLMPFHLITAAVGEWIFGSTYEQREIVCQIVGCLFIFSILTATESLALLSFDRFFFITKALEYKRYMTVTKALLIVAVSWLLAAFMSASPFYGIGAFEFTPYGMCVPGYRGQIGYTISTFIIALILVGSITVTSIWTVCFIRKYFRNTGTQTLSAGNPYAAQERRVIGLFGMLIIVHMLCYSPIVSFALIEIFTNALPPTAYAVAIVFLLLLTTLIPLVQSFFRRDIRDAIVKGSKTIIAFIKKSSSLSTEKITVPTVNSNSTHVQLS